jgi:hypothetical protein
MTVVAVLAGAVLFPPMCLVFLLWMSHLEDTLTRDVHRARRRPEPAPILAIPVRPAGLAGTIPAQRTAPPVEVTGPDATVTT